MLDIEIRKRVGYLTLNRVEKKNALNFEFIQRIKTALDELVIHPQVKLLVIKSSSDVFCAGADLEYLISLKNNSYENNVSDTRHIAELFDKIYNFPKLTIAQVEGHAIAGGCGIATACDFCYAVPDAKFGYSEVRIGFVPALVSVYLVKKIGESKARELLLTGKLVSGEEAYRLGIINAIVTKEAIQDYVDDLAIQMVETTSEISIRETKKLLVHLHDKSWEEAIELATIANAKMRETGDFKKGLNSFIEKVKLIW
ncbi:MAG: enoyl-CoA hydratase/isomerase family protein [Chitinophagales bacterium]|jgi:methylglutaconyl-CoA hydratase|nr:enoyl-CoA hydratase/isomerase family protein [Sphingobacteriales bacterium]